MARPIWITAINSQMTGSFQTSPSPSDEEKARHSELVDLLVRYSRRWKTLSLGLGVRPVHQEPLAHLTREDVSLLEVVHVGRSHLFKVAHQAEEPYLTPISNLLCEMASLHSLQIDISSMSALHKLVFHRERHLSLNHYSPTPTSNSLAIGKTSRERGSSRRTVAIPLPDSEISSAHPSSPYRMSHSRGRVTLALIAVSTTVDYSQNSGRFSAVGQSPSPTASWPNYVPIQRLGKEATVFAQRVMVMPSVGSIRFWDVCPRRGIVGSRLPPGRG